MRIACTTCNALYDLPPERVRPGRGVRCARCKTVWVPVEQEDAAPEIRPVEVPRPVPQAPAAALPALETLAPEAPASGTTLPVPEPPPVLPATVAAMMAADEEEDAPAAALSPASAPAPSPGRGGRAPGPVVAWVVSIVLLGAAAYAVIAFRGPIAQLWPPSQRLYAWLGLG